jgi:hypothetical protein
MVSRSNFPSPENDYPSLTGCPQTKLYTLNYLGESLEKLVGELQTPAPEARTQFLEQGILNICAALEIALKAQSTVVEFTSDGGQMTDGFSGTRT